LYPLPNIRRIIKSRQMVLAEHITYGTDKPCTENFVKPATEKILLGRKRVGSMNWIHFT
jgi:hypothetical protein